jgi:hypothetical protein
MGTVTQYKMSNFQSALGGSNPIRMSEYYRGVTYVPYNGLQAITRQPTSSDYYNRADPPTYWVTNGTSSILYWFGSYPSSGPNDAITVTSGMATYYRGTYRVTESGKLITFVYYGIYRYVVLSGSVNTSVPSSGQIKFSNLYAAENYSPGFMGGVYTGQIPAAVSGSDINEFKSVSVTFYPDGTWRTYTETNATLQSGNWGSPTTSNSGANYWIKFTRVEYYPNDASGASASTPTTAWLNLGSARTLECNTSPGYGNYQANYTTQIALDSAGTQVIDNPDLIRLYAYNNI